MKSFFLLSAIMAMTVLSGAELELNKEYAVIQMNGVDVKKCDGLANPTLLLDGKEMRVSGTSGINRYAGGYEIANGVITISQPLSTMMAGPDDAMKVESEFLRIISVAMKIEISDKGILLSGKNGSFMLGK